MLLKLNGDVLSIIASYLLADDLPRVSLTCTVLRKYAMHTWKFQAVMLSTQTFGNAYNFCTVFRQFVFNRGLDIEIGTNVVYQFISVRRRSVINRCVVYDSEMYIRDKTLRWKRLEVIMKNALSVYRELASDQLRDLTQLLNVLSTIHMYVEVEMLRSKNMTFKSLLTRMLAGENVEWSTFKPPPIPSLE